MTRLADRLVPCGPILDAKAAERAHEAIAKRAGEAMAGVDAAWAALAPVFAASPYLASLARKDGQRDQRADECPRRGVAQGVLVQRGRQRSG